MQNDVKQRIGAVRYLNTKPLIFGLADLAPNAELVLDLPSRLADGLAGGTLDIALIPSIEYLQDPAYTIVSDACIACRGPVLSVKLFSRVPVERIRTLALDEGSRTSVALIRILLKERYGLEPELRPLAIGAGVSDVESDAVLVIGDRAMHSPGGPFAEVWDLGDEWCRWTGLPFVFAMWVARPGFEAGELETSLSAARDLGLANLEVIAASEAAPLGLSRPQCVSYLRDNLYFYLGDRERRGLERFRDLAQKLLEAKSSAAAPNDAEPHLVPTKTGVRPFHRKPTLPA
ncbi:MAG TPA: menaquinone biosynthesis protein [Pirellulales bacterium]|nr:menaquinone biosynthesis protein [Pirellulales bacterium]